MRFAAAPEYQVFPTEGQALKPYVAAVRASAETRELIRSVDPDVVVADILTVAAALAAELEERPWATLVPHVLPMGEPGFPVYAVGAVLSAHVGRRAAVARARPLLMRGRAAGARGAERDARARRPAAAGVRARRDLASAWRWWRPSPSSSTRAQRPAALAAGDRAAAVGAALRRGGAAARETSR